MDIAGSSTLLSNTSSAQENQENEETETSNETTVATTELSREIITRKRPFNPRYRVESERRASFDYWPIQMKQSAEEMVAAGFFYLGAGDMVACYHCGIHLAGWQATDTAWFEHRYWLRRTGRRCEYMDVVKGKKYYGELTVELTASVRNTKFEEAVVKNKTPEIGSEQNVEENIQNCIICMKNKLRILLFPCLHVATCEFCAVQLEKCSMCRKSITGSMHVYLP